jgi:hypothetical protein
MIEKFLASLETEELKLFKQKLEAELRSRADCLTVGEIAMWTRGNQFDAIKAYRTRSGLSLLESKRMFEALNNDQTR